MNDTTIKITLLRVSQYSYSEIPKHSSKYSVSAKLMTIHINSSILQILAYLLSKAFSHPAKRIDIQLLY